MMDLFDQLNAETNQSLRNYLPCDGTVNYFGKIMSGNEADGYLHDLLHNIAWLNDQVMIGGKTIFTKRKVAWYGDKPFSYTYSNVTKHALPWTNTLLAIKRRVEEMTNETFNACLLNLYHTGEEGMAWHSDGEKDLKKNGAIASISFGAQRKFCFKHKQKNIRHLENTHDKHNYKVDLLLEHGSLLVMKDCTQTHWLHRLPPTTTVLQPRVNLTFRTIDSNTKFD